MDVHGPQQKLENIPDAFIKKCAVDMAGEVLSHDEKNNSYWRMTETDCPVDILDRALDRFPPSRSHQSH